MNSYTYIDSPIGRLLLGTDGEALVRIDMDVPVARRASRELDVRPRRGTAVRGRAPTRGVFRRPAPRIRPADPHGGHGISAPRLAMLMEIPYGQTRSYGEQAKRIGNPNASRAVGLANGRNPIPILVPCHRVIGADGSLTGYGGGLDRKRWLLAHEGLH